MSSNRRRSRRRLTPNQVKSLFVRALKVGGLMTVGFLTHRLLTSLIVNKVLPLLKPAAAAETTVPMEGFTMATFERPLVGLGVMLLGVPVAVATIGRGAESNKQAAVAVAAGMVGSFTHSLVVSLLHGVDQPTVAAQFEGYSNSLAYALRGRALRGYRGLGRYGGVGRIARRTSSIMPRYRQVGQYRQAAAGYRGLAEYFQPSPMGEYFVPPGVQGVGQYEAAGPLAMQASAGFGQVIDEGIRPDDNLDAIMDLAESAAGVGQFRQAAAGYRGTGEYFTAARANGDWTEQRVPTQDQWIPSGPLWAGTRGVRDTNVQSELAAGILAGPGGNGILSGS
jgi:hypothetical protein